MYWIGERLNDDILASCEQAVSTKQAIERIKGVQNIEWAF